MDLTGDITASLANQFEIWARLTSPRRPPSPIVIDSQGGHYYAACRMIDACIEAGSRGVDLRAHVIRAESAAALLVASFPAESVSVAPDAVIMIHSCRDGATNRRVFHRRSRQTNREQAEILAGGSSRTTADEFYRMLDSGFDYQLRGAEIVREGFASCVQSTPTISRR